MKKALSLILAAAFIMCAAFAVGCLPNPEGSGRETGDIDVNYGKLVEDGGTVMNVEYSDDTPITFMYPNYFTRSSDEDDSFVAKGPDDYSVLMFKESELSEGRSYDTIAAYSDEEAQDWMTTIQLGLVSSQHVKDKKLESYKFSKLDDHLYLLIDLVVTYETGLVQRNTLVNCILPEGTMYSIQAYAPESAVTKYGPLFSEVEYNGSALDEALSTANYKQFENDHISFAFNDAFNFTETNGVILSMVPDKYAMLAGGEDELGADTTYDSLKALSEEELLNYLCSLTSLPATESTLVRSAEENGVLRLEAQYSNEGATGQKLYCVVTRFVKQDGSCYTLFAYMNEPAPIKDIVYTP